ncbi:hypothetical protein Droror1_Dr00025696 [Drosera rotundifolia]
MIMENLEGTGWYMDPEYQGTGEVSTKVDVFSYGVVLLELITGKKFYDNNRPAENRSLLSMFIRFHHSSNSSLLFFSITFSASPFASESDGVEFDRGRIKAKEGTHRFGFLKIGISKKKEVENYEEEDGSVYSGIYDAVSVDGRYGVVGCLACGFVRALALSFVFGHFLLPAAEPSWRHTIMYSMDIGWLNIASGIIVDAPWVLPADLVQVVTKLMLFPLVWSVMMRELWTTPRLLYINFHK